VSSRRPPRQDRTSRNPAPEPAELEQVILRLLSQRSAQGSICPSDAARVAQPEGWRDLMDEVRAAAGRLAAQGEVDITQGGRVIDIAAARGPVRIRRHRPG
jgi:hypothetical protein